MWMSPKSPMRERNNLNVDPIPVGPTQINMEDEMDHQLAMNAVFNNDIEEIDCVVMRNKVKKVSKFKRI
jgi:hypothetical protein